MSTTWRYIVSVEENDEGGFYQIRELYESDNGEISWTKEPITPLGESPAELVDELSRMATAIGCRQMLDLRLDPPRLVKAKVLSRPKGADA